MEPEVEDEAMECDSTSPDIDPQKAEVCKIEGNKAYSAKDYTRAIDCYTQAISHNPSCASYYGNRAAAYMMLEDYQKGLKDAQHSITLDEGFVKGYLRAAKCQMMLGSPDLSIVWYDKALALQPNNTQAQAEKKEVSVLQFHMKKAEQEFERQEYRTSVYHIDRCLQISSTCLKFKTLKAEALAMSRKFGDCLELCHDLLRADINNCDAIYAKGLCHYYQDDTTKAHQLFQKVLRVDPDHTKARLAFKKSKLLNQKKEEGNSAYKCCDYQRALDLYTEALEIDPINVITNAKLYCNRALMAQKLGKYEEGIEDCTKAIELDEKYVRAYQRRAGLYQQTEQYEESVRDWKKVCDFDRNRENQQSLKEAEKQLKMSKRKNYYKILGIEKHASEDEIKRAYRKKAMLHHPDRHSTAEVKVREEEEKKFKEVSEAYSVLSDPKKRMRYDNGQDLEDMGYGMNFDPNEIFINLFNGEMGGGMGGGGRGGFGGFSGFGGSSPFFEFRMS